MKFLKAPVTAAAALLLTVALQSAGAQRVRRSSSQSRARIDTTFTFDKSGSITVTVPSGNIVINGTSGNQLHVRAESDNQDLRLDVSSTRVMIQTSNQADGVELTVPQGVQVIAQSRSGDITISGTHGQVEVHATNGDIHVDGVVGRLDVGSLSGDIIVGDVAGNARIQTTGGDVKITNIRGGVDVGTVSGDIQLHGVTARDVRARTTSGDVTFDGLIDPAGTYEFYTHSGDVGLHVQRDASAQLTVSTWNGTIDSEFPITLRPGEHEFGSGSSKRFTFMIGKGEARLSAETFSGDINISANGHGAAGRP